MAYAAPIGSTFTDLFSRVVTVAVKVVIFLAILALGWLVARWIWKAVTAFLYRVGFDRAAERGGLHRVLGRYTASDIAGRLVAFTFLLFVLQLAFGIFGPNAISDLIARGVLWLPRLFVAVVIVVVVAAIGGWVKRIIMDALGGLSYGRLLGTAAQVVILALGTIAALNQIGVASSVVTAVLWALLLAIVGIAVVGVGGGLIRPMQHRWERMLNRAESETAVARAQLRRNRAARVPPEGWAHDVNAPGGFGQPGYRGAMPTDEQPPPAVPEEEQMPADHGPEGQGHQ
jgi:hypothetical protein